LRKEGIDMTILLIIAIVLFVFWLLGFSTRFIASGVIHVVLVIALILFVVWLLRVGFRAF
jgi:lipopolysaccharide export LptBFGC system permease protein LptF